MKHYALALTALVILITPAKAQYDYDYPGPPMWDRDYRSYRGPSRRYGPQYVPCIYYGDCAGPKWGDPYDRSVPGMPPFRLPPPPSRRYYWDD